MLAIQNFQQRLYDRYKNDLTLPPAYHYLYGNPIQPLIPLPGPPRPVCLIGASPPARLASLGIEHDVPVGDEPGPFSNEAYFDGRRVRAFAGRALDAACLTPLGLRREQCWLTYLVRVFLFKDEHLAKYRRLGCPWPEWETAGHFETLARQGLPWLSEELALARPRLVITLGVDVAGILQDVSGPAARQSLLGGEINDLWLEEAVYPAIHLADLDSLAGPPGEVGSFLELHRRVHLPAARRVVAGVMGRGDVSDD